jgi:hypothetical protein
MLRPALLAATVRTRILHRPEAEALTGWLACRFYLLNHGSTEPRVRGTPIYRPLNLRPPKGTVRLRIFSKPDSKPDSTAPVLLDLVKPRKPSFTFPALVELSEAEEFKRQRRNPPEQVRDNLRRQWVAELMTRIIR